jgi:sialate O-acetylesterase
MVPGVAMSARLRVRTPFSDHMVLQRGTSHKIWGWDEPDRRVELSAIADGRVRATATGCADAHGKWTLACPELPAGGPYEIQLKGSSELVLRDVLVGEVWLASGQSNMEWRVMASADADAEMAAADIPEVRVLKVDPRASLCPSERAAGIWRASCPQTVGDFTAIGYFFARALYRQLKVPIGIIDSTWGGTRIEAWTSLPVLARLDPEVLQQVTELAEQRAHRDRIAAEYAERVTDWQRRSLPGDVGNQGEQWGWHQRAFDDSSWREIALPRFWQSCSMPFNGVVWFRRSVTIPQEWVGRDLFLSLGAIDDFDHTYLDGTLVGSHPAGSPEAFQIPRRYTIPGHLVRPGESVIAVRVFDHFGQGGFAGPGSLMFLSPADSIDRVPLAGPWRCGVEREIPLVPASVFRDFPQPPLVLAPQHAPASLYNAMVAPLVPFGIRGALWYQGESNIEGYRRYRERLVALIRDWRTQWGQGQFPFYLVQLASYWDNGLWPWLREAQTEALTEPATGMVTALDIGDPSDIHPRNKREVGRRLALIALSETYGRTDVVSRGPALARFEVNGHRAIVSLDHASGLTTSNGDSRVLGFELAGRDGRLFPAAGRIEGEKVVLECAEVAEPCVVRYAWADCPAVNLINGAGLPALPFRTDADRAEV